MGGGPSGGRQTWGGGGRIIYTCGACESLKNQHMTNGVVKVAQLLAPDGGGRRERRRYEEGFDLPRSLLKMSPVRMKVEP